MIPIQWWLRWIGCKLGIHNWVPEGDFQFCSNPGCERVIWFTGTRHFELDICNSAWVDDYLEVQ